MGELLESSAERRLQSLRRDLTLDLFTRHGPFWELIADVRRRWGIEPEVRVPPRPDRDRPHLPPRICAQGRNSRAIREDPDYVRWSLLLERLHCEVVPETHRVAGGGFRSEDFWDGFLSGCLLYDPPADDLLGYADAPVAAYGDFLNVLAPWEEVDTDAPQMVGAPIVYLYDSDELRAREEKRREQILDALHEALAPTGFDVWEFANAAEYRERQRRLPGASSTAEPELRPRPYIEVGPATIEEDVRAAYRILSAAFGERPRAIRPTRDRLTAVQCAIWRDAGWTQERIGERFGWTVQRRDGMTPRCENARLYVNEGRQILRQRKPAA